MDHRIESIESGAKSGVPPSKIGASWRTMNAITRCDERPSGHIRRVELLLVTLIILARATMRMMFSSRPLALATLVLFSQYPNQLSVDAFGVSHRPSAHPPSSPLYAESNGSLISGDIGKRREEVARLRNRIDDAEAEIGRLADAQATYPEENALAKLMNFRNEAAEKAKNRRVQLEQDVATWKTELAEATEAFLDLEDELEFASDPKKSSMSSTEANRLLAKEREDLAEAEQRAKEEENKLKEKNERDIKLIEDVKSKLEAAQANFETKQAQVEKQLAEGSRKRARRVERIASRYKAIRADIAQLLKGSSNQDNAEQAMKRVQAELRELEAESNKLSVEREILATEKAQLTQDQKAVDERIAKALQEKDFDNDQLIQDIAKLQSRGDVYKEEVAILQIDLDAELAAKERIEIQMKEQRDAFEAEQKHWAEKNRRIEADLSAKAALIQRKYDSLRKDMIDILAREKNAAREREMSLLTTHASEIKRKSEVIGGLEATLLASQNDKTVLRAKNVDLTKQRDAALRAVSSGEMKIDRYEGSLREQLKLSIRLTRKRSGNSAKAVKSFASSQFKKLKGKL